MKLYLFLLLSFPVIAFSQEVPFNAPAGSPADRPANAAALTFTPAQQAAIQAISAQSMAEAAAIRGNASIPEDQKVAQLKALSENMRNRVFALLTPEQQSYVNSKKGSK